MSDNILSAVLTFSLLAGGTVAIGSEMFSTGAAATPIVTLPQVMVVGQRVASLEVVSLPKVTITGRRETPTTVAVETQASEPQRVQ